MDRIVASELQALSATMTGIAEALPEMAVTEDNEGIQLLNNSIVGLSDCTCATLARIDMNIAALNKTVDSILTYFVVVFAGDVIASNPANVDGKIVYQMSHIDLSILVGRSVYLTYNGAIDSPNPVYIQDKTGKLYPLYQSGGTTPVAGSYIYAGNNQFNVVIGADSLTVI